MLGRLDAHKDHLQQYADAAATSVGALTGIVVGAVRDIGEELGSLATELLEIRGSTSDD
jgi:hypothetical protein